MSSRLLLEMTRLPTGMALASYLRMLGGSMPGGRFCISPLTSEMTWLAATSRIDLLAEVRP